MVKFYIFLNAAWFLTKASYIYIYIDSDDIVQFYDHISQSLFYAVVMAFRGLDTRA